MTTNSLPKNAWLNQILNRAQKISRQIGNIEYLHILRKNNKLADEQANKGVNQNAGQPQVGEITIQIPIP